MHLFLPAWLSSLLSSLDTLETKKQSGVLNPFQISEGDGIKDPVTLTPLVWITTIVKLIIRELSTYFVRKATKIFSIGQFFSFLSPTCQYNDDQPSEKRSAESSDSCRWFCFVFYVLVFSEMDSSSSSHSAEMASLEGSAMFCQEITHNAIRDG